VVIAPPPPLLFGVTGVTATEAVALALFPLASLQLIEKVVVAVNDPLDTVPADVGSAPFQPLRTGFAVAAHAVALAEFQVSATEAPELTLVGVAASVTVGASDKRSPYRP
jgi:hypothetical protein